MSRRNKPQARINNKADTAFTVSSTITSKFNDANKQTLIKWSIKPQDIHKFQNIPTGNQPIFKSQSFVGDQGINWLLSCYPNGRDKNSIGSCMLYLATPQQQRSITVYFALHCVQTNASFAGIAHFKPNSNGRVVAWAWPKRCQLSNELDNASKISFIAGITILEIANLSGEVTYKNPLNQLARNHLIVWKLDKIGDLMNKFKAAHCGKCFVTAGKPAVESSKIFNIRCFPNGSKPENKGNMRLELILRTLPKGVESIKIKFLLQCKQLKQKQKQLTTTLSYSKIGAALKLCPFAQLASLSSMEITAYIDILECYDSDGNTVPDMVYKLDDDVKQNDDEKQFNEIDDVYISNPVVIVIGISEYQTLDNVKGCKKDISIMKNVWETYGFKTIFCNFDNPKLTVDEFWTLLRSARMTLNSNKSFDSLILCFSGHGGRYKLCMSEWDRKVKGKGEIDVSEIQSFFSGGNISKHLISCPKLLLLNACRGNIKAVPIEVTLGNKANQPTKLFNPVQDFAVIYSNALGFASFSQSQGSYFTRCAAKILSNKRLTSKTKLCDLVKIIRKKTLKETETRQCVEFSELLTNNVYFKAN